MKKKMNFRWLILIALIMITLSNNGCKSTSKIVNERVEKQLDTVFIQKNNSVKNSYNKKEIVYLPSSSTFNLGNPCDSLGNLKKMNFNTKIGNLLAEVNTMDGNLEVVIKELDSLRSVIETKDKQLASQNISYQVLRNAVLERESKKSKTVIWTKWTWIFLASFLATLGLLLSKFRVIIPTIF